MGGFCLLYYFQRGRLNPLSPSLGLPIPVWTYKLERRKTEVVIYWWVSISTILPLHQTTPNETCVSYNSLHALGVGLQVVRDTGLHPGAYALVRPRLGGDGDVPLIARLDRLRHLHPHDVLVLIQLAPKLLDRPLVFFDLLLLFLDQFIFYQQSLLQICDVYRHLWGIAGRYLGSESLKVIIM